MNISISRKQFIQGVLLSGAAALAGTQSVSAAPSAAAEQSATITMTQTWDKTFPKSSKVDHSKVTFKNRYGITLAADLYVPKDRGNKRLPALAITGPFGAVKEQSSGLYAQTMAERGYVTIAFDPSYTGESSGEPRNVASPDINTEDFSAAVDFLGTQSSVNREQIGIIGICGYAGMGLNAATVDTRIKAVATTSMYDMSRVMAKGYNDSTTKEQRAQTLDKLSQQRWADASAPGDRILPETLEGVTSLVTRMYFDYYRTPRGFHERSANSNSAWTATMPLSFMNLPLLTYINEISPRPILLIAGENAHSRYFSEDAFKAAGEPKELMIIPGADHVDLYDQTSIIPWEKLDIFFTQHLK